MIRSNATIPNASVESALANISRRDSKPDVEVWRTRLQRLQALPGASNKLRQVAETRNAEQLADFLAECLFALVFAGLGHIVELEPVGDIGPDLRVSRNGADAFVEVTRFRSIYPGPKLASGTMEDTLPPYGNVERDINKVYAKALSKLHQLKLGASILAFWNDDADLEEIEASEAASCLLEDSRQGGSPLPPGLLFTVYSSANINVRQRTQIYCSPLQTLAYPYSCWLTDLDRSLIADLV